MPPKRCRLRDYQNDTTQYWVERMQSPTRAGLSVEPTGAGKTHALKCAIKLGLDRGIIDGAIYVVPQVQIESQFAEHDFIYEFQPGNTGAPIFVDFPKSMVVCPRNLPAKAKTAQFQGFLSKPGKRVFLTTYSQFLKWEHLIPADTSRIALFFDEGHHLGKDWTKAHRVAEAWFGVHPHPPRGGFVGQHTASPDRMDQAEPLVVVLDQNEQNHTSYSHLVARHGFPMLHYRQVMFTSPVASGVLTMANVGDVAQLLMSHADPVHGIPPVVIHIQRGNSRGDAEKMAHLLMQELQRLIPGIRILNAVGLGKGRYVARRLAKERELLEQGFQHRTLDVVISCERLLEGADWPACCLVISLGHSTSIPREIQKLRHTRPKGMTPGYPACWAADSTYVVMVPQVNVNDPKELRDWAAVMLEHAAFLECSDVALDISKYFADLTFGKRYPPVVRQLATAGPLDPAVAAGTQDFLAVAVTLQTQFGRPPTIKEMFHHILTAPNITSPLFALRAVLYTVSGRSEDVRRTLKKMLESFIHATAKVASATAHQQGTHPPSQPYRDVFLDMLLNVAQQHANLLVQPFQHSILGMGLEGKLTAQSLQWVVGALVQSRDLLVNLDTADVHQWCKDFRKVHGYWPDTGHGEQSFVTVNGSSLTVGDLDRACRRKGITLSAVVAMDSWLTLPSISVPRYKQAQQAAGFPFPNITIPTPVTAADILLARANPAYNQAGKVFGVPGENYFGLALMVARGCRGATPDLLTP